MRIRTLRRLSDRPDNASTLTVLLARVESHGDWPTIARQSLEADLRRKAETGPVAACRRSEKGTIMMSETQREVAVHLLANGLRKLRLDGQEPHRGTLSEGAGLEFRGARRGARDEAYVKGMLDMLSGLFGATYSNELLRAAYALERSASTR